MSYDIVTVRSGADVGDDSLYPELSAESEQWVVALTEADGRPLVLRATGLDVTAHVDGRSRRIHSLSDLKIEVLVTDARVAIGCSKYDKGGGWVGFGTGAIVALAANGVSKTLAARRRRGRALVGHIRYPWLTSVGGIRKQGWLSSEELRISALRSKADGQGSISLTLTLDKSQNSLAVAREITHRAAAWRLSCDDLDADEERAMSGLLNAPELASVPKQFALHRFPTSYPAIPATAYPKV